MPHVFVPGLELNAAFYAEAVAPLVRPHAHAAALLGWGSDVLGYDTERSTDHGWGPRLQVFVDAEAVEPVRLAVEAGLPKTFRDWPVRFGWDREEVRHRVEVHALGGWLTDQLGVDPRAGLGAVDWLLIPQQQLLGVVGGAVYADPSGELAAVRDALAWYPHDVWLWLLACQWHRIGQEEAFVGRASEVGDELGSRLVAARMVHEVMRLAFLYARTYRPYMKWFGTAFAALPDAAELGPVLERALAATEFATRENALVAAYETLARRHNAAGLTEFVDPVVRTYRGRPFRVLMSDRFTDACRDEVRDPWLWERPLVGSVDQAADSTDVLGSAERAHRLRALYE